MGNFRFAGLAEEAGSTGDCIRRMVSALFVGVASMTLAIAPDRAHAQLPERPAGSICLPPGNYPVAGSKDLALRTPLCFTPPAPGVESGKASLYRRVRRDSISGTAVGSYTYDGAVHHCLERQMRLPSEDELKALVSFANGPEHPHGGYAIVASKGDKRYPGGLYGWGGQSGYWSSTFGGRRFHHVVSLTDGRGAPYHDSHRAYVSCAR